MKRHTNSFCRTYKKEYKKQIVVCRECSAKRNCQIFMVYVEPDLIFKNMNRSEKRILSYTNFNSYPVCFGIWEYASHRSCQTPALQKSAVGWSLRGLTSWNRKSRDIKVPSFFQSQLKIREDRTEHLLVGQTDPQQFRNPTFPGYLKSNPKMYQVIAESSF